MKANLQRKWSTSRHVVSDVIDATMGVLIAKDEVCNGRYKGHKWSF